MEMINPSGGESKCRVKSLLTSGIQWCRTDISPQGRVEEAAYFGSIIQPLRLQDPLSFPTILSLLHRLDSSYYRTSSIEYPFFQDRLSSSALFGLPLDADTSVNRRSLSCLPSITTEDLYCVTRCIAEVDWSSIGIGSSLLPQHRWVFIVISSSYP